MLLLLHSMLCFFFFYRVLLKMFFQTTPSLFRWFVFFFVICFASNWSMVLLSTNWLLQKQKNKQTSMRRRTGETKITNLYTPLAELPSPLELSKIKNILLLHRVCNPFWGFLRATVFFPANVTDGALQCFGGRQWDINHFGSLPTCFHLSGPGEKSWHHPSAPRPTLLRVYFWAGF